MDFNQYFPIGKTLDPEGTERHAEIVCNGRSQSGIGSSAENKEFISHHASAVNRRSNHPIGRSDRENVRGYRFIYFDKQGRQMLRLFFAPGPRASLLVLYAFTYGTNLKWGCEKYFQNAEKALDMR